MGEKPGSRPVCSRLQHRRRDARADAGRDAGYPVPFAHLQRTRVVYGILPGADYRSREAGSATAPRLVIVVQ